MHTRMWMGCVTGPGVYTRTCRVAVLAECAFELGQTLGGALGELRRVCEQLAEPELRRHTGVHRIQLRLHGFRLLAQLLRQRDRSFRTWMTNPARRG